MKFSHLIRSFVVLACTFAGNSTSAKVWSPYLVGDPDRIDHSDGYCKTPVEEKKLWGAIYKFSESFLNDAPQIPPEQKSYIKGELQSGNYERMNRILQNPMYRIDVVRTSVENLSVLSSDYLKYHNALPLEKKMEFIGRSFLNVIDEEIEYERVDKMVADLQSKNYFISSDALKMYWAVSRSLKGNLVYHLICYGGKYSSKSK